MSAPVATERKSFLPLRSRTNGTTSSSRLTLPMPSVSENNNKTSLTVGNRVLVNGLKSGTLRYIGTVQFAQGLFCGVELDQAEGKHDGEVKDIRYFQCAPNHGIFVPRDKVVLESRPRASSSQRPVSRLKPPTMTRSSTLTSAINKIESAKPVQLPDIVPNSTPQPVTLNESIVNDAHEILHSIEPVENDLPHMIDPPALPVDEAPETIEADFTDSVSLILRQLQQEDKLERRPSSMTISEEDSEENDDDGMETESVVESVVDQTHRSSVSSIFIPQDSNKSIQTDLSFPIHEQISFSKIQPTIPLDNKKKSIVQPTRKPTATTNEKRPIASAVNPPKRPIARKPAMVPAKKGIPTKSQLNPKSSITSQSKLSQSLSSCNSLNSSQSDVTSMTKPSKSISDKSQLTHLPSTSSESDQSHTLLLLLNENQSLQANNQRLKTYYQHLLHQFDLILLVQQYHLHHLEQFKEQHRQQLSKIRLRHERLQNSIEQARVAHHEAIDSLNEQYQNQLENLRKTHGEELNLSQQKFDQLLHEKTELESRCAILQEKVDGFLTEMANSEHADVLLCHVETLEKDRTSLQSVLELKTKEITHLRTRLNEQVIKLSDEQTLQKRITMAENRIQDLEWLLREKQLSEKAALIERDQLRERTSHLEREFGQIKFENETLRYRLQDQTTSIFLPTGETIESIATIGSDSSCVEQSSRHRSSSVSSVENLLTENDRLTRSLSSFNGLL